MAIAGRIIEKICTCVHLRRDVSPNTCITSEKDVEIQVYTQGQEPWGFPTSQPEIGSNIPNSKATYTSTVRPGSRGFIKIFISL
jgi:hypothetical protein